jgi:hypothetical protein
VSDRAITVLLHGPAKIGKTTLAMTAPYPRLLLDVERASRFVQAQKVLWDPMSEAPPVADGTWDTCVVKVDHFSTAEKVYEWLKSGQHQFRSVIIDSLSELQPKVSEQIAGRKQLETRDWGTLLQKMSYFCRDLRDLIDAKNQPIEAIVLIATSREKDGRLVPYLQGQIGSQVPYWYDITGYLYPDQVLDEASNSWVGIRRLLTSAHPTYDAGNRVPGLPDVIDNPNIEEIINSIFGPRPEDVAPAVQDAQA